MRQIQNEIPLQSVSKSVNRESWIRSATYALAFITIGILLGCGGGGGGTSTALGRAPGQCPVSTVFGSVQYNTVWGSAPASASQVIQLIDGDGFTVRSDSVNRSGALTSSISMTNVTAGTLILKATIYSAANATGTVLGESRQIVDLCAASPGATAATAQTQYGVAPTSLGVNPTPFSMPQGALAQFVATGWSGQSAVFLPVSDITWSVGNGIGTVSATGKFTAVTVGNGTVVAQSASTSLSGAASVNVTQTTTQHTKWTILVYLNAANDLYTYSTLNMNQMEQVAGNPDVRFVVQWKQSKSAFAGSTFDGVRRYLVKPDNTSAIASTVVQNNLTDSFGNALDMGNPQTLKDFLDWGVANYPADRYCLILWNHGNGWKRSGDDDQGRAFSYDDQYGTSIKSWQTDQALAGHHFDIIAWDASLMQMMEVAYEVRNFADYVVGSEESPPGEGYPYHLIFDNFAANPTAPTATLADAFVQGMQEQSQPGGLYEFRKITQSVLESSKLGAVASALGTLSQELQNAQPATAAQIQAIRNNAQSYSPTPSRVYRDIVDICLRIEADLTFPSSVRTASANVRAAIAQATVSEYHNAQSPNSHGLAIDFSSAGAFAAYKTDYQQLHFSQDTNWDDWLSVAP